MVVPAGALARPPTRRWRACARAPGVVQKKPPRLGSNDDGKKATEGGLVRATMSWQSTKNLFLVPISSTCSVKQRNHRSETCLPDGRGMLPATDAISEKGGSDRRGSVGG